jgi:hypothetical protein
MSKFTQPSTWERVTSEGRTVYHRRPLAKGHYLTVTRVRKGCFIWNERGPEFQRQAGYLFKAHGTATTVQGAKAAADAHMRYQGCPLTPVPTAAQRAAADDCVAHGGNITAAEMAHTSAFDAVGMAWTRARAERAIRDRYVGRDAHAHDDGRIYVRRTS